MPLSLSRKARFNQRNEMSFIDHLDAFRGHLFRCIIAIVIGAVIVGIYNSFFITRILMGPTHADFPTYSLFCKVGKALHMNNLCMGGIDIKMQSTAVSTQFSMFFTVLFIGGFILAFPFILWEFWKFIKPALTKKELERTKGVIFWVSALFFLGVLFGYFVIAPYTVNFFANFKLDANIENRWTINSYLDMLTPLILGSGLAFQLPLIMYFLTKVGVISSAFLRKYRKHAIIIMLIVAGVITPPDVLSQIVVTFPLVLLYEISILLAKKVEKRKLLEA